MRLRAILWTWVLLAFIFVGLAGMLGGWTWMAAASSLWLASGSSVAVSLYQSRKATNAAMKTVRGLTTELQRQADRLGDDAVKQTMRAEGLASSLDDLSDELSRHETVLADSTHAIEGQRRSTALLKGRFEEISTVLDVHLEEAAMSLSQLTQAVQEASFVSTRLEDSIEELGSHLRATMGEGFQGHDRYLDTAAIHELADWIPVLELDLSPVIIRYRWKKLLDTESRCIGRLATTSKDAVLRSLVVEAAVEKVGPHIAEVGVLFGVNAVFLWEVIGTKHPELHQTLIDPYAGFYEMGEYDPATGVPVTASVVVENLRRSGLSEDRVKIVIGYSHDEQVLSELAGLTYSAVLIDGDHSYQGVRRDFANYFPLVADGGYVLFDDYGSSTWPDVTRAVDDILAAHQELDWVGWSGRTAVVRRASDGAG